MVRFNRVKQQEDPMERGRLAFRRAKELMPQVLALLGEGCDCPDCVAGPWVVMREPYEPDPIGAETYADAVGCGPRLPRVDGPDNES